MAAALAWRCVDTRVGAAWANGGASSPASAAVCWPGSTRTKPFRCPRYPLVRKCGVWPFSVRRLATARAVALGIHLVVSESGLEEDQKLITVFTDANVELSGTVLPGQKVITSARKLFFRRRKLRAEVEMRLEDGTVVCSGQLSGMGVPR